MDIVSLTYIALGVFLGYTITVSMFLVATIGIASGVPRFAVHEYRITTRYKLLQDLLWLGCTAVGSFGAAVLAGPSNLIEAACVLAATLLFVLWRNTWEVRERGLPHQILLSVVTAAGITLGSVLAYQVLFKPAG